MNYESGANLMDQAADELMNLPRSEAIVTELREEAAFLRYGDKASIGTAEGVEQRYVRASLNSRIASVERAYSPSEDESVARVEDAYVGKAKSLLASVR